MRSQNIDNPPFPEPIKSGNDHETITGFTEQPIDTETQTVFDATYFESSQVNERYFQQEENYTNTDINWL